jgi:hypothetical protein
MSAKKTNAPNCKECGKKMSFVLGLPSSRAMTTADEYRKKSVLDSSESLINDRAKQFFVQHEIPRMIAEEGIESVKGKGFVDADGNPK